jgi:hypothetical protein
VSEKSLAMKPLRPFFVRKEAELAPSPGHRSRAG